MPPVWKPHGPRPTKEGQVEGIPDKEVVGSIKCVAAHPTDADIVYIGAVNGGVWRTRNATAAHPVWEQLTDNEKSLSIGALQFDPTDHSHDTIVAGTGRFSSISRMGGGLIGLLRSTNAGNNWTTLNAGGQFKRFHICGVAPRGNVIVVATNNGGVFRTTNTGTSWTKISGAAGTGLPAGNSFALAGDPTDPSKLYVHIGTNGIFRSTNTGANWTKVSNAAVDNLLTLGTVNVKIAIGHHNNVYVAIANGGRLAGLFRSGNGGTSWTALDVPSTVEVGGHLFGIHPGGQAGIHMSLAADRESATVVYIGGDRQVGSDEAVGSAPRWPNSVGATDYSGRLFRVDSMRPAGSQATHITHSNTASRSAPHADSRDMTADVRGDLLETDDGGIYRRTKPLANNGDWRSMNGNLQTTEFHSAAWDPGTHTIIGGAQDTGSPQQLARSNVDWTSVSTGDGGVVLASASAGFSTRYSSYYQLGDFRREVYDAAGTRVSRAAIQLFVLGGGAPLTPYFYTPIELNQVTPTRLIIGAANSVYESDDQGDTVTEIGPGIAANEALSTTYATPIAYGATGNPDLLYVGSGNDVFVRNAAHPAPLTASATYPRTGPVVGIAVPLDEPQTAYVIDAAKVYGTIDAGATWQDITGGLLALGGAVLHAVAYCPDLDGGSVVVGTNAGLCAAAGPGFAWNKLGSDLPTVPVFRLEYAAADRILLAGTLGRGAWTLDIAPAVV
jgi:photosystem II stability/assembly factor-like uncharacterized protein